jgi:hypothetical protein
MIGGGGIAGTVTTCIGGGTPGTALITLDGAGEADTLIVGGGTLGVFT